MIRRIQQFTTQSMPVATIAGLEPKVPAAEAVRARAGCARAGPCAAPRAHARQAARRSEHRGERRAGARRRARQSVRSALPVRDERRARRRRARPGGRPPSRPRGKPRSVRVRAASRAELRRNETPPAGGVFLSPLGRRPASAARSAPLHRHVDGHAEVVAASRRTSCPRPAPPATGRGRRRRGSAACRRAGCWSDRTAPSPAPGR